MTDQQSSRPKMPSVILLGAASGLSPFGVTILVPLLAGIAEKFDASFGHVQFLVSAYLLGLAVAQPFTGFLCDRFGRRPVMLTGFAIFVLASLLAAFASTLDGLIILRFLQAAGVSVGTVASRAVVRDTRGAAGAAETLSYIAAAMGVAPILAPIIGGWMGSVVGYQSVFLISAAIGALVLIWAFISIPETLDPTTARSRWGDWLRNYRALLWSGSFMGYSLIFGFIQGSFFAFLAVGAIIFSQKFGMSERTFGLVWGSLAISYVLSAMVSGRLTRVYGPDAVVGKLIFVALTGGGLMLGFEFVWGTSLAGILIPLLALMVAAGGILPGALAGAVNVHPEIAGTASGLSSAVGVVVGGMFTVIAGFIYDGEFLPIAFLVAVSATLTAVVWWFIRRYGTTITGH